MSRNQRTSRQRYGRLGMALMAMAILVTGNLVALSQPRPAAAWERRREHQRACARGRSQRSAVLDASA